MKHQKIEAGACDTGPNENCVLNTAVYSKNTSEKQSRNCPAPLHLLVDHRLCRCARTAGNVCGCTPSVFRLERGGSTIIGVKNPPYGFGGSRVREFIGSGTKGRDAYQAQLWIELRALAWAKHDSRERERALALRERIARAEGRL